MEHKILHDTKVGQEIGELLHRIFWINMVVVLHTDEWHKNKQPNMYVFLCVEKKKEMKRSLIWCFEHKRDEKIINVLFPLHSSS